MTDSTNQDGPELVRTYQSRSGKTRFKPSIELLQELDADNEGFCIHCGEYGQAAEPDARHYVCEGCGEAAVFGAAELMLMGLYF